MKVLLGIKGFVLSFIMGMIAYSCANIIPPSGGIKDSLGPVVQETFPLNMALNVKSRKIKVRFDEYIRSGSYAQDIYISPLQKQSPIIKVIGKSISIELRDSLLPNTTYVINLGSGIQDHNEGNKMSSDYSLAFSTGNKIDSLSIKGKIINSLSQEPYKSMGVFLFKADSIQQDSFENKQPIYATLTDDNGLFELKYLAEGEYKIYGVDDKDKSYTFNQEKEWIAICKEESIVLKDSIQIDLLFSAFPLDQSPPAPPKVNKESDWLVSIIFTESIDLLSSKIKMTVSDTLGNNSIDLEKESICRVDDRTYFVSFINDTSAIQRINFYSLSDSLGNLTDTFCVLPQLVVPKIFKKKIFSEPTLDPESNTISISCIYPWLLTDLENYIYLEDSLEKHQIFDFIVNHNVLEFKYDYSISGSFDLTIEKGLYFEKGFLLDSTHIFPLSIKGEIDYGTLSGFISSESYPGNWLMYILDSEGNRIRREANQKFKFLKLNPGKYNIRLIDDKDSNGVWTPGSIYPKTYPEKVYNEYGSLDIRANWEVEKYEIVPDSTSTGKKVPENSSNQPKPEGSGFSDKSKKKKKGK